MQKYLATVLVSPPLNIIELQTQPQNTRVVRLQLLVSLISFTLQCHTSPKYFLETKVAITKDFEIKRQIWSYLNSVNFQRKICKVEFPSAACSNEFYNSCKTCKLLLFLWGHYCFSGQDFRFGEKRLGQHLQLHNGAQFCCENIQTRIIIKLVEVIGGRTSPLHARYVHGQWQFHVLYRIILHDGMHISHYTTIHCLMVDINKSSLACCFVGIGTMGPVSTPQSSVHRHQNTDSWGTHEIILISGASVEKLLSRQNMLAFKLAKQKIAQIKSSKSKISDRKCA